MVAIHLHITESRSNQSQLVTVQDTRNTPCKMASRRLLLLSHHMESAASDQGKGAVTGGKKAYVYFWDRIPTRWAEYVMYQTIQICLYLNEGIPSQRDKIHNDEFIFPLKKQPLFSMTYGDREV